MFVNDVVSQSLASPSSFHVQPVRLKATHKATIAASHSVGQPNPSAMRAPFQHASVSGRLRGRLACQATSLGRSSNWPSEDDSRRLLKYVRDVSPNEVQAFIEQSPPAVVAAFKQTVANMVGTLPPQHFSVTIDTVADSLAQLMQTMLRTGYLLRNVQYQLDLELALSNAAASMNVPEEGLAATLHSSSSSSSSSALEGTNTAGFSLPGTTPTALGAVPAVEPEIVGSSSEEEDASLLSSSPATSLTAGGWAHADDEYAPGVQCKVDGHVLRWHQVHGVERMDAQQYIQVLEAKVKFLEQQLQQQRGSLPGSQPALALPQPSEPPATYSLPVSTSVASEALSHTHATPGMAAAAAATAAAAAAFGGYPLGSVPHAAEGSSIHSADLLGYLRTLDSSVLASLAECGQDVGDAMQAFVARLMGTHEREHLRSMTSEFTAVELSKLLFWLLVVGWSLRALEVRGEEQAEHDMAALPVHGSTFM